MRVQIIFNKPIKTKASKFLKWLVGVAIKDAKHLVESCAPKGGCIFNSDKTEEELVKYFSENGNFGVNYSIVDIESNEAPISQRQMEILFGIADDVGAECFLPPFMGSAHPFFDIGNIVDDVIKIRELLMSIKHAGLFFRFVQHQDKVQFIEVYNIESTKEKPNDPFPSGKN